MDRHPPMSLRPPLQSLPLLNKCMTGLLGECIIALQLRDETRLPWLLYANSNRTRASPIHHACFVALFHSREMAVNLLLEKESTTTTTEQRNDFDEGIFVMDL